MNISEIPDSTNDVDPEKIFRINNARNIHFIKNAEGKRVAVQLSDNEAQEMTTKKEIGICIVGVGHMEQSASALLKVLTTHEDFIGEIIMMEKNDLPTPGYVGLQHLEEQIKPFIITALSGNDTDITIQQEAKPYSRFGNHYMAKTQKSKASKKKYIQRKK